MGWMLKVGTILLMEGSFIEFGYFLSKFEHEIVKKEIPPFL